MNWTQQFKFSNIFDQQHLIIDKVNKSSNEKAKYLEELNKKADTGGGADRIAKQHEKGKLTARERIAESGN